LQATLRERNDKSERGHSHARCLVQRRKPIRASDALDQPTWTGGRRALELHASVNALLNKGIYSDTDKKAIIKALIELGLDKSDDGGTFAMLRQNRGHLLKRINGTIQIVAKGREDWIGWVELKTHEVNELATQHTAMVIRDVNPDILAVIEMESRPALKHFSHVLLPKVGATPFAHVMLIDGNDDRGIDVGVATRPGFAISRMQSHVDDADADGQIFSRDCAEYVLTTPNGGTLLVLVNHFKSKGFGGTDASDKKRERQARRVAALYNQSKAQQPNVVVLGDFNDTPGSGPLKPLLQDTDLVDISQHPKSSQVNLKADGPALKQRH
jgi:endonuclease/exonuclease/phosphatase family metal-dependent hydrolase